MSDYHATLTAAFENEIRDLNNLPFDKIKKTVDGDLPIVIGAWIRWNITVGKYCGCLMMDDYITEQGDNFDEHMTRYESAELSWSFTLYEFYGNTASQDQIVNLANAFDEWARSYNVSGYLSSTGRLALRSIFDMEDKRRQEA